MENLRILMMMCCFAGLASCSSNGDELFPDLQEDGLIKFEIGFAREVENQPKVATNTDFTSSWENGDKIGVYIVKGGNALLELNNYADNVEFTYNNGSWTTATPIYYPNDGDNLSFYAYYPYDADMNDPNAYTFNVPTDQASNRGEYYKKNDFLWTKRENVPKSDNAVVLQFSHALAMIELAIIDDEYLPPKAYLLETITDCTIDLYSQSIALGSTKNTIQMQSMLNYISGTYIYYRWALVPPQTMDIHFVWNLGGTYYRATPETNAILVSGTVNKYTINQP